MVNPYKIFKYSFLLCCFLFFCVIFSKSAHAQQYKCKVDQGGGCVPCSPTTSFAGCTTGFQCPGDPNEAAIICGINSNSQPCPSNDQTLQSFPVQTCAGTATPALQYPPNAIPRPYVPCSETRNNEFHSLRPYQASPCNQNIQDTALYCSNAIIANDTFSQTKQQGSCTPDPENGVYICDYNVHRDVNILVDLRNAELPIAGNTEDVRNYKQDSTDLNDETVDDAQKLNEYISWYLNGTRSRAEYPFLSDSEVEDGTKTTDHERIVDQTGPLQRLLPRRIQDNARVKQIEDAESSVVANGNIRHNQIAGCTRTVEVPRILPIIPVPMTYEFPVACNSTGFLASLFGQEIPHRLVGDNRDPGWYPEDNRPPLEENYDSFSDYYKAYKEWRGSLCVRPKDLPSGIRALVPSFLQEVLLCANPPAPNGINIAIPDYVAELFPYIPFSSTEDRVGDFRVEQNPPVQPQDTDPSERQPITITDEHMTGKLYQNLYFPHMQENEELSDLLQQTYVPQGVQRNGPPDLSLFTAGQFCEVRQARANPGDELFGEQLTTTLSYNAKFQCEFVLEPEDPTASCESKFPPECHQETTCDETGAICQIRTVCDDQDPQCYPNGYGGCDDAGGCPSGYKCALDCDPPDVNECTVTTLHSIPTYTETPFADSIWSRLVAGPMAALKKFFPKFGLNSPITQLQDIPAVTSSSYSTTQIGAQVFAGTPQGQKPGTQAEIYFPHLGSIHKYFLGCLQDLIRPQGFGPNCMADETDGANTAVLGEAVNVSNSNARSVFPWVTMDASGYAHITYFAFADQGSSNPVGIMYSNNTGGSFSAPQQIAPFSSFESFANASIDAGPNNILHFVYSPDKDSVFYKQATINGSAATLGSAPNEEVSGSGGTLPRVVVDQQGNAHIVWAQRKSAEILNIAYRVRSAGGGFSGTTFVHNTNRYQTLPSIALTNDGSSHIVYIQNDGNLEIYYSKVDGSGTPGPAQNISASSDRSSRHPFITSNGTALFAVWEEEQGGTGNHDIMFRASLDGGANWQPAINVTNNTGLSAFPSIAFGASGRAYIVWSDDSVTEEEIWYAEYSASTNSLSSPAQITSLDNGADSKVPIVATGPGNLGVTWQDAATGVYQVYFLGGGLGISPPTGGTPPAGQCSITRESDILTLITTTWGLPTPQTNDDPNNASDVPSLKQRISSGPGNWAATQMLAGERYAQGHGFPNVLQYLTTAWLWFENAPSGGGYPDPYEINCNQSATLSNVAVFCTSSNFQIGGYQAAGKNYRDTFTKLYGGTSLSSLLSPVINNSNNALRNSWSYTSRNPSNGTGLFRYMSDVFSATTANLSTGSQLLTDEKTQFISLLAGKDPAMVAALNSAVSQTDLVNRGLKSNGPNACSDRPYQYICGAQKQTIANMIYALWLLDCNK